MAQERKFQEDNRAYSEWHRRESTSRFVSMEIAELLSLIDVDYVVWVECTKGDNEPVAIIEATQDVGQPKPTTLIKHLSQRTYHRCGQCGECSTAAGVPAYLVKWKQSSAMNPANARYHDIDLFTVQQIWPALSEPEPLTPQQYARWLWEIRQEGHRRNQEAAEHQLKWLRSARLPGGGYDVEAVRKLLALWNGLCREGREEVAAAVHGFDGYLNSDAGGSHGEMARS